MKNIYSYIFLILVFSILPISIQGQTTSIKSIKSDPAYYWGEGEAATISKADQIALAMLCEQISVSVESSFELLAQEEVSTTSKGRKQEPKTLYKEFSNSMVKTHARATLKNTERIVIEGDENYVFRYMKRSDVNKIFDARKEKANEFYKLALNAEQNGHIGEAMKYYYWSLGLLKSHPDGMQIQLVDRNKELQNGVNLLTRSLESILQDINFSLQQQNDDELLVYITYKGKPIDLCDFQYHLGDNWSESITCRDGYAAIQTFGAKVNEKMVQFRIDYMYENQWHIDDEVQDVMEHLKPMILSSRVKSFTSSIPTFKANPVDVEKSVTTYSNQQLKSDDTPSIKAITSTSSAVSLITQCNNIYNFLQQKDTMHLHQACTEQGWQMFSQLLDNGSSQKLLNSSQGTLVCAGGSTQYRNVPVQFSYKSTGKSEVQNIVFRLNSDKQIESVAFSVNQELAQAIMDNSKWDDQVKMTILNFIENYQTAYALKRLDYLESVFDKNALIITGTVLKRANYSPENNQYYNVPLVRRNRYTKEEYLQRLRTTFRSNEYINIRFADISIVESKVHKNVFGLRMRQDYYSTTYGDSGWLFLMVDLRNPDEPIIHVRVWQEEKDSTFGWADIDIFD